MSDSKALWDRACADPSPFEFDEVVPDLAKQRGLSPEQALKTCDLLLKELERLPEGKRFFRREGNAVVPLPEFLAATKGQQAARDAYPFEL
ncbi:MAG: hypothetical protein ABI353_14695 [Isosphaeraceae bacterium]